MCDFETKSKHSWFVEKFEISMMRFLFSVILILLMCMFTSTDALPRMTTSYTRRYGNHHTRKAQDMPSRVERGSEQARQISDLLRRRRNTATDKFDVDKRMYRTSRKLRHNHTHL